MAQIETYIPLYRKYRPQDFASIVGQEAIVQTLTNAIKTNKIAHAYLFCGPRGTGKTSAARIFAKSLNCATGPTESPCQQCEMCTGITQGNALDVVEFDAASNNSVQDARELIENAQFAPMAGRYKIYIIDEVHMLSTSAFNALLKTLEEPPPNVIFVFATTEAHKVLPTIISRCQRFDFARITVTAIIDRLKCIADEESVKIDPDALAAIARHARGGMRDALGLLDQVSVISRVEPDHVVSRADVARFIGSLEEEVLLSMTDAIAAHQTPQLLNAIGELVNRGVEPGQLTKDLTQHFRNLFLVKTSGAGDHAEALGLPKDYYDRLQSQSGQFDAAEFPQILEALGRIDRNIRMTQQPQLWLEVGLLELAYRQDIHVVKDLAARVEALEGQLAGGVAPTPQAAPVAPPPRQSAPPPRPVAPPAAEAKQAAPAERETAPVASALTPAPAPTATPATGIPDWHQVIEMISSLSVKSLLRQHSFLIEVDGTNLTIGCSSDPIMKTIQKEDKFFHLQKAVDLYFGQPMRINLILEKGKASSPAPKPEPVAVAAGVSEPPMEQSQTETRPADTPPPAAEAVEVPSAQTPQTPPVEMDDRPETDISEAQQYTVELLQGKVMD